MKSCNNIFPRRVGLRATATILESLRCLGVQYSCAEREREREHNWVLGFRDGMDGVPDVLGLASLELASPDRAKDGNDAH